MAVALLAAASDGVNGRGDLKYWRYYCSDLRRAHRTARIVLGLEDGDGNDIVDGGESIDLVVDPRLRELAKGAREGYPKKLRMEEAMELRRREAPDDGAILRIPKLESIDDAWNRAKDWIDSLVEDASDEYYSQERDGEGSCDEANGSDASSTPKVYDVFALSHSAMIRTMIHRMVDDELPRPYATTGEGSLLIPNLSRTIIDVRPHGKELDADRRREWTPSLFRLTDVSHLGSGPSSGGPPYL